MSEKLLVAIEAFAKGNVSAQQIFLLMENAVEAHWLPTVGGKLVLTDQKSYVSKSEAIDAAKVVQAFAKKRASSLRQSLYDAEQPVRRFWSDSLKTRTLNVLRAYLDNEDFYSDDVEAVVAKLASKGFSLRSAGVGKHTRTELIDAFGEWALERLD